jgi:hypothetical protein
MSRGAALLYSYGTGEEVVYRNAHPEEWVGEFGPEHSAEAIANAVLQHEQARTGYAARIVGVNQKERHHGSEKADARSLPASGQGQEQGQGQVLKVVRS